MVQTHAIELAENSIFTGIVRVARRQVGCMRFCYVPAGSRTPRRYACQPDLAAEVAPNFKSTRYGESQYCRLSENCPVEIARGASDESEMGVYHDLYEPQRWANLRTRLEEFVPVGFAIDFRDDS
jgi:hypothetical protein